MSRRPKAGGGRKQNVHCVKPSDPPFLRAMKERCGYKEGPDVNTKRQIQRPDPNDSDEDDRDDERPQIVVLREGDLTQEEADKLLEGSKTDLNVDKAVVAADTANSSGKMVFSSSSKRPKNDKEASEQAELSSKKKKLQEDLSRKKDVKAVKDNRLLSFGDDEEEDE